MIDIASTRWNWTWKRAEQRVEDMRFVDTQTGVKGLVGEKDNGTIT